MTPAGKALPAADEFLWWLIHEEDGRELLRIWGEFCPLIQQEAAAAERARLATLVAGLPDFGSPDWNAVKRVLVLALLTAPE